MAHAWCTHSARMVHVWCTYGQVTHEGWHVRYGGGELSTEWVTSGQAALLWHTLTPTMHSKTLHGSRVTVPWLAAARVTARVTARHSECPLACSGPPSVPKAPLRRLPIPLRLAHPGPRPRWARMRLPRCNATTPSAPPPSPRPAWSWDDAPRGDCSAQWSGTHSRAHSFKQGGKRPLTSLLEYHRANFLDFATF